MPQVLAAFRVPWLRSALVLVGGVVALDGLLHVAADNGTAVLGLGIFAGGWWLFSHRPPGVRAELPSSLEGWFQRCQEVLEQLEQLEAGQAVSAQQQRQQLLEDLRHLPHQPSMTLAIVGCAPPSSDLAPLFAAQLGCTTGLRLQWSHPLPTTSGDWHWPDDFQRCDVLLYHLKVPMRALDLRWLESVPTGMPVWLLIEAETLQNQQKLLAELLCQWPPGQPDRTLFWSGDQAQLADSLPPLATWLRQQDQRLRSSTVQRCLEGLHQRWQVDLESLRRREWLRLQQRSQWIVAAAVFAAPLPSLDLLLLGVVNGMMLKEMAQLWDCTWNLERLRVAALELARVSLAMGVVEWSSQALASAAKLHGATWLVGGALQALSAAYLTRVVGHAMADMLALTAGVAEPDLETIKRQAPLLIARAAEAERIDWPAFLHQGRVWLRERTETAPPRVNPAL